MPTVTVDPSNLEQDRAWNGEEGSFWVAHAERFDQAVVSYDRVFLDAAAIEPTHRVLDVGCGAGKTTREAARRARAGSALGIDLSSGLIALAARLAERQGVRNARFVRADAQVYPFAEGEFDVAISRTGASFFGDPPAAFANIARAVRPRGRLVVLTWQPAARNEWFSAFTDALDPDRRLPRPSGDAPGAFSLGDPDRARGLLTGAGFDQVRCQDHREPMYFGRNADDAFRFLAELFGWMLRGLDAGPRTRALDALRADLERHQVAGGVRYGSAAWLITARRP